MNAAKLIGSLSARLGLALAVALGGLAGCDSKKIAGLEEGFSTEADVRARFGEPGAVFPEADGGHTLEYTRQPEGRANYFITIGPDGRMSMLRQVLTPANFAKIVPGLSAAEVRRSLGRPAAIRPYALRGEEVWEWRFQQGQETRLFSVSFGRDGRVMATGDQLDPKAQGD